MRTPEWYEKKEIKEYLDSIGAWHFSPFMAGRGKSGVPDLIACINGRFVGIEVKRPNKMPTPLQNLNLEKITRSGGLALWGCADKVIAELEIAANTIYVGKYVSIKRHNDI